MYNCTNKALFSNCRLCRAIVVVAVVVVAIMKLYLVQTGRFLAATGSAAPSPNHVQIVFQIKMYLNVTTRRIICVCEVCCCMFECTKTDVSLTGILLAAQAMCSQLPTMYRKHSTTGGS